MWPTFLSLWLAVSGQAPQRPAPRRRPAFRRSTLRPGVELLEDRTVPSTVTWINPNGGNWNTASNWQDDLGVNRLPGSSDDAVIGYSGITVTHSGPSDSVHSLTSEASITLPGGSLSLTTTSVISAGLTISGGILSGDGDLTVSGLFTWTSGEVRGPQGSVLTAENGVSMSGGDWFLTGRTLVNPTGQTTTWAGGNFWIIEGAAFVNAGTFAATGSGTFGWRGSGDFPRFENQGAFVQGATSDRFVVQFDNAGTVDVQGGTLVMGLLNSAGTGSFSAPGGKLDFEGYWDLAASSTIDADRVVFGSYSSTVAGRYDAHTATVVNAGATFTGEVDGVGALTISGGTADFSPAAGGPVTLILSALDIGGNGLLKGTDSFDVTGPFTWTSGEVRGPQGSALTAENGVSMSGGDWFLTGRTLVNPAGQTTTWAGGNFWIIEGAAFVNAGTFAATGSGTFGWRGSGDFPRFENQGAFVQGATSDRFVVQFDNAGTVDVQGGTLVMGLLNSAGTGSFSAPGGKLDFEGYWDLAASSTIDADRVVFGSYSSTVAGRYDAHTATVVNAGATFTGEVDGVGALTISGGTADFSPAAGGPVTLTLSALDIRGNGLLKGTDSFDVTGPFTWTSGEVRGPQGSALTAENGVSMSGGDWFLTGRTLVNPAGQTTTWAGGNFWIIEGAAFVNAGTFAATGSGTFSWRGSGDLPRFENFGQYTQSGGSVRLGQRFDNAGTVELLSGTLVLDQSYTQTSGATVLAGGSITSLSPLAILGGILSGSGMIAGSVINSGQVAPGSPVGIMEVSGGYTQSASGDLAIQISGLTPGTQYSQLRGDGNIALDGSLHVSLAPGFTPNVGDTFTLVKNGGSGAVSGTFAGLPEGAYLILSGYVFQISYASGSGHDVTVAVTRIAPPSSLSGTVFEDFNDDGQVDFGEKGVSGVKITLTGTDDLGNAVNLPQTTDGDGAYVFLNLRPGCYSLTEAQPAGYPQGIDSVGTAGGSLTATDQFSVCLGVGVDGLNYNFGEQPPAGSGVHHGQTAGIGFWNNKNGQALIKALNGGSTSTQLGNWLAATLPNTFGASAGGNDLTGKSNAYVAALFQSDFVMKGVKLDAQVLATALSVYATNATLDPTAVAAGYGFTVSGDGAGTATTNVGSNGDAFGVANNSTMTLMDLLLAADAQAVHGVLYGGNAAKRNEANTVFSAVNQAGGL